MVFIKDNFLPEETFVWLNNLAKQNAVKSLQNIKFNKNRLSKFYTKEKTAWDHTEPNCSLNILRQTYGNQIVDIFNKIENECKENNIQLLEYKKMFFLFATTGYLVPTHRDKNLLHSTMDDLSKIYKAFIFCHSVWKPEWKGELCFSNGNYLPLPNRLLIYSGDEKHWVEQVQEIGDNLRMIFAIRFGEEQYK